MNKASRFLMVLFVVLLFSGCKPAQTIPPTQTVIQPTAIATSEPIPTEPAPTPSLAPTSAPQQVEIVFFPDINANGIQDSLDTNQRQASIVSYSDLIAGRWGEEVDYRQVDETFDALNFDFSVDDEICFKIKDNGEEIINECQQMQENLTFSISSDLALSEDAIAFLTINGLNTIGIGYVSFSAQDITLPLNEEYAIHTTTYEQLLGEQTSIIIRKPLTEFLADPFSLGVKLGNHVLPFFPVDLPIMQVKNTFDFSPDPAIKYDEFGLDTLLEHDINGNDGTDFYPMLPDNTEVSLLVLAGTTGEIVFTDIPTRGVIEICPSVNSQKSCSALERNNPDPETISVLVGDINIGTIDSSNFYMQPGEIVNPGYPVAVIGAQGFDLGQLSLQYSHRYRFQAHHALPMLELSEEVISGINLRDYPDAFIASELIQRCPYSIFTADIEADQFLAVPDDAACQMPFFSWVIDADEVFAPLPDAEIVSSTD